MHHVSELSTANKMFSWPDAVQEPGGYRNQAMTTSETDNSIIERPVIKDDVLSGKMLKKIKKKAKNSLLGYHQILGLKWYSFFFRLVPPLLRASLHGFAVRVFQAETKSCASVRFEIGVINKLTHKYLVAARGFSSPMLMRGDGA
ncbi:hypothetical protein EVAR_45806_1 [Eumeta japonica]|uniref:Uncharacterized protein n=1 Tax=Eumeta variegata TaxID=151549 RepID=A0A4C1X053_EUMVA|nr:hypothetical protein EVAR_45806_1 [Eumeta japonica]